MESIVLGINIGHDRGAAILENGILLGAIAQERVDRIKHSTSMEIPFKAIDSLLNYFHISFNQIKYVGLSGTAVNIYELEYFYYTQLEEYYNYSDFKIIPVTHHLAHAESVFNTSGFEEAIIFVADGGGELIGNLEEAETIFWGKGKNIHALEQRLQSNYMHSFGRPQMYVYPFMNKQFSTEQISLGKKYSQITALLGFGLHGAGKTMGLAPYGKNLIDFKISPLDTFKFSLTFTDILDQIYNLFLKSGESYFLFIEKNKANIAQTMQCYLEKRIHVIVDYIIYKYQPKCICLAGGLFLNCPVNHQLIKNHPNINFFIFPACGDDGQAIGAAFHAYKMFGSDLKCTSFTPYLGLDYKDNEIKAALIEKNLKYKQYSFERLSTILAKELKENKIIGLLHGRSEIGPRALCHRSIIASPTSSKMKDYLNKRVKHRETFRPFGPAVIDSSQFEIFNLKQDSPFMLLAAQVSSKYKGKIPAVTHIDGSARIQSISKHQNPFIYDIILKYASLTGIPVILNTSFNDNNEPIVESPYDAINTFLKTNIDILVIEDFIVYKESSL